MRESLIKVATYFLLLGLVIIFADIALTRGISLILLFVLTYVELNDTFRNLYRERDQKISKHVDEIQKNQSKIERDKTRFLSLIDTMGNGLVLVDIDGKIKYVNREFEEYFGNTEYVGRAFDETIHDKGLVDFIKSAYLKEIKMKSEMDSGSRVFDLIATPLFQNKIFIGCIILIHDITIIKNSEKMQKGFIADASHELRTPITSIKGMSEILLRDEDMNIETRKDFLSIIHTEGGRLEHIVEDLMQMSRLERSNALSKTEAVNIKEVADEVMKSLEIEATKQNLNLVNHSEGIEIQADRNMIYRLIANLVKNAIAYSDQGDITVSTEQDDDTVTLFISDQGIGIPLEEMDNIFERFYRVDKARTRDSGGTGLGLSICKKIVTLHGGSIDLKSTIGEGTTFEITFNK